MFQTPGGSGGSLADIIAALASQLGGARTAPPAFDPSVVMQALQKRLPQSPYAGGFGQVGPVDHGGNDPITAGAAGVVTPPAAGEQPVHVSPTQFQWGGRVYGPHNAGRFLQWLQAHNVDYQTWARTHPQAAAKLQLDPGFAKFVSTFQGRTTGHQ